MTGEIETNLPGRGALSHIAHITLVCLDRILVRAHTAIPAPVVRRFNRSLWPEIMKYNVAVQIFSTVWTDVIDGVVEQWGYMKLQVWQHVHWLQVIMDQWIMTEYLVSQNWKVWSVSSKTITSLTTMRNNNANVSSHAETWLQTSRMEHKHDKDSMVLTWI